MPYINDQFDIQEATGNRAHKLMRDAGSTAEYWFDRAYDYFEKRGKDPEPALLAGFVISSGLDEFAMTVRDMLEPRTEEHWKEMEKMDELSTYLGELAKSVMAIAVEIHHRPNHMTVELKEKTF